MARIPEEQLEEVRAYFEKHPRASWRNCYSAVKWLQQRYPTVKQAGDALRVFKLKPKTKYGFEFTDEMARAIEALRAENPKAKWRWIQEAIGAPCNPYVLRDKYRYWLLKQKPLEPSFEQRTIQRPTYYADTHKRYDDDSEHRRIANYGRKLIMQRIERGEVPPMTESEIQLWADCYARDEVD